MKLRLEIYCIPQAKDGSLCEANLAKITPDNIQLTVSDKEGTVIYTTEELHQKYEIEIPSSNTWDIFKLSLKVTKLSFTTYENQITFFGYDLGDYEEGKGFNTIQNGIKIILVKPSYKI